MILESGARIKYSAVCLDIGSTSRTFSRAESSVVVPTRPIGALVRRLTDAMDTALRASEEKDQVTEIAQHFIRCNES